MAQVGRLANELMVQELSEVLQHHTNFFVTSIGRLQATEADTLRKHLRTNHARLFMIKRRLGLRGLKALALNGEINALLEGSVAMVISPDDVVQTAKCIMEFAKANEEKLVIRGGWIEGQLLDRKHVEELASLPSRPQLIARVVCAIESPLADLIVTLERLIGDVAWIVEEASKTVKPVEPVQTGQPANGQTGQQNPTEHTGGETNHA